ncbi:MAG: hypothetical protein AAFZ67_14095 [Planctomycetota bacterium]
MNLLNAIRVTTIGAGLLAAAGLAQPVHAQVETETVRERVVVTLPSGKRIVRVVERQVPVTRPAEPAPSGDPFAAPGGDSGQGEGEGEGDDGGSNERRSEGEIDPRIVEWIGWYRAGDMKADSNGDGRVTAADFNAFLKLLNGDDGSGGDGSDGDDNSGGGDNGDTNNGGGDDSGDNGDGDTNTGGGDDGSDDDGDTNTGGGTGGPETGWTEFERSADTMVFYVAESGSDANDGLSPSRPLRTVSEGIRRLRDGKPDWLLLRRGDVFSDNFGSNWSKSGRSASEKMVIGAYGDESLPRPVLNTGTSKALTMFKNDPREHLAFVSLELRAGVNYSNAGISITAGGVEDVLFEDLLLSGYTQGIAFNGSLKDIAIRRCVVIDSGGATRAQALYAEGVDGLLVEQSVFDRNGWIASQGRDASTTIFAHNVYIQRDVTGLVFRDNFTSRASSHGLQVRNGGDVLRNVFWQNPIALSFGNENRKVNEFPVSGNIDDNVVLEAIDMNSDQKRGWGIQIQNANGVSVSRNIFANARVDRAYGLMLFTSNQAGNRDLVVADNVIDDFGRNIRIDTDDVISTTFRGNTITSSRGSFPLFIHRGSKVNRISFEGNQYRHNASSNPLELDGSRISLQRWRQVLDRQGRKVPLKNGSSDPYVNGSATLATYARTLGYTNGQDFIAAMRKQRKGSWDKRLTPEAIREFFGEAFTLKTAN